MVPSPIRILGLDPGLRRTGWGVIDCLGNRLTYVACGQVVPDETLSLGERLAALHQGLAEILKAYTPDEAAVEETFVNQNPMSTLKLGQARGIAMLAPAQAGILVAEYKPNLVKKTVVGTGHAGKEQIGMMIGVLLPKAGTVGADAADALAVAITHAHHRTSAALKKAVMA
jgi:crossover junction endodeoxyribonuclease RuvC